MARELTDVPFIFREEASGTRSQVERALLAVGATPRVPLTLPTGEDIVLAVELGIGVSIVFRFVADAPVRGERIARVRISDLEFHRTFRVVRLARATQSPAALAFMALIGENL